jgi:ankyrin repeat protein
MSACRLGHVEIAEMLMTSGAKVNNKNKLGETSLMMAYRECHMEIVERLLSNGATTFVDEDDQMYERYYGDDKCKLLET